MRRLVKPFYWICVGVLAGYLIINAIASYPPECWESGSTHRYCTD